MPVIFCHFIVSNFTFNTKHTPYYYSISTKSNCLNSNKNNNDHDNNSNNNIAAIIMLIIMIILLRLLYTTY